MAFEGTLLHNQEKRDAHLRRADKFLDWLRQPQHGYAHYSDISSNEALAKLITKLIIWAFEVSMPDSDWKVFEGKFRSVRDLVLAPPQEGVSEETHYLTCVSLLTSTLLDYKGHIEQIYTQK